MRPVLRPCQGRGVGLAGEMTPVCWKPGRGTACTPAARHDWDKHMPARNRGHARVPPAVLGLGGGSKKDLPRGNKKSLLKQAQAPGCSETSARGYVVSFGLERSAEKPTQWRGAGVVDYVRFTRGHRDEAPCSLRTAQRPALGRCPSVGIVPRGAVPLAARSEPLWTTGLCACGRDSAIVQGCVHEACAEQSS